MPIRVFSIRNRIPELLLLSLCLCPVLFAEQRVDAEQTFQLREGTPLTMIALPEYIPFSIPLSPAIAQRMESTRSTTSFTIRFNPLFGCSGVLSDWPAEAKTAFQYAADIWGNLLNSSVDIPITACWVSSLSPGVLGQGGPMIIGNFPASPYPDTYYPLALANALSARQLTSQTNMVLSLNSSFSWYFGTDGAASSTQYDFVSVVLHELGHGLGFIGLVDYNNGIGYVADYPSVFDRFTRNGATPLLSYRNYSVELGSALTGGNLFFDGEGARTANLGLPVPLYAPSEWNSGSSYSHLDFSSYRRTENALMVYAMGRGQALHNPGPVTLGIFKDIGWTVSYDSLPTSTTTSTSSTTTTGSTSTSTTGSTSTSTSSVLSTTTTLHPNACIPGSPTILCLNSRRFRVEALWRTPDNRAGSGQAVPLFNGTDDTVNSGYFWFFSSDNVELTVKILDGRQINGRFWVFYGTMTDVEFWIIITDTFTGRIKQYYNPMNTMSNARDTNAF